MALKFLSSLDTPVESALLKADADGQIVAASAGIDYSKTINLTVATAAATAAKLTSETVTFEANTLYLVLFTLGNSVSSPTINGKNIRIGTSNASTTTFSIGANSLVPMYYNPTTDVMQITGSYRTGDSTEDYNLRWENSVQAGETITRYKVIMEGVDGRFYPLTIENTTGATKTVSTREFRLGGTILIYNSTTTRNENTTFADVWVSEYTSGVIHYTFNQSSGFLAYQPVYLVGTVNANGNFVLDNSTLTSWLTQTLPSEDDGKVYVYLGIMNNTTTAFRIEVVHPIYQYKDGALRLYSGYSQYSDVSGIAGTATALQTARTLTIGSTGKQFNGSANVSWSLAEIGAAQVYRGTVTVGASGTYTTVATVVGNSLASAVRMTIQGTSGNVVINVQADILVNHYQDILITTTSGFYTQLLIRIISNDNEAYSIEVQPVSAAQGTSCNVEIFPLNNETVTFGGSPVTAGTTLTMTTRGGVYTVGTGGNTGTISAGGDLYVAGNAGIGTTSPAQKLDVNGASILARGAVSIDPDAVANSVIAGAISDTSWGVSSGIAGMGSGAGDTWAIGHNSTNLYFGIGNGTAANSMATYIEVTPSRDITFNGQVRITSGGNVGIGTTNPTVPLQIVKDNATISMTNTTAFAVDTGSRLLLGGKYSSGTSNNTSSFAWIVGAKENATDGNQAGYLSITTVENGGGFAERMRVTSTGNVGIGTTAPTYGLVVANQSTANSATGTMYIGAALNGSGKGLVIDSTTRTTNDNAILALEIINRAGGNTMAATVAGNVGIGTTNPTEKLDVAGSGKIQGNLFLTAADPYIESSGSGALRIKHTAGQVMYIRPDQTGNVVFFEGASGQTVYLNTATPSVNNTQNSSSALTFEARARNAGGTLIIKSTSLQNTVYDIASNLSRFSITGQNVLYLEGNVGVGTTAPDAKLVIVTGSADSSGNSFSFTGYGSKEYVSISKLGFIRTRSSDINGANMHFLDNGGTTRMELAVNTTSMTWYSHALSSTFMVFQHTTGNVGIGTTSPNAKLNVRGTEGSSSVNPQEDLVHVGGNELGGVSGYAGIRIGGASNTSYGAYIRGVKTTAYGNYWNTALTFSVTRTNTETTVDEVMRITSAGNVGIGTTAPGTKLDVRFDDGVSNGEHNVLASFSRNGSGPLVIGYRANGTSVTSALIRIGDGLPLTIGTTSSNQAFTLLNNGNVGIGTTSPAEKLVVSDGGAAGFEWVPSTGRWYRYNRSTSAYGGIYTEASEHTWSTVGGERMRITSGGNVGIGTTAPQQLIHILGATNGYAMIQGASDSGQAGIYFKKEDTTGTMARTKGLIVFHTNVGSGWGRGHLGFCLNSADSTATVSISDEKFRMVDNGDFLADGDVVAYSTTISDARYKTNIQPIESALDKVNQMRGVSFDWTAVRSGREFGVIAQEIEQIAPEVVSEKELLNGDTMKTVSYTSLVPFLIESIKELTAKVEELESKLNQK